MWRKQVPGLAFLLSTSFVVGCTSTKAPEIHVNDNDLGVSAWSVETRNQITINYEAHIDSLAGIETVDGRNELFFLIVSQEENAKACQATDEQINYVNWTFDQQAVSMATRCNRDGFVSAAAATANGRNQLVNILMGNPDLIQVEAVWGNQNYTYPVSTRNFKQAWSH